MHGFRFYAGGKVALAVSLLAAPAAVASTTGSGGEGMPDKPVLRSIACVAKAEVPCPSPRALVRGGALRIQGARLAQAKRVVFLGGRSRRDDVTARVRHRDASHADATVPGKAKTGRVAVIDSLGRRVSTRRRVTVKRGAAIDTAPGGSFYVGGKRKPSLTFNASSAGPVTIQAISQIDGQAIRTWTVQATPGTNVATWDGAVGRGSAKTGNYVLRLAAGASAASSSAFALRDHLFPIRGRHNLGYTRTNRFGGGRGHQGIDMFARCGTRIAAARSGKVRYSGYHSRAGYYVVVDGSRTGNDYVYMHMRKPALVDTGDRIFTGQKIGEVGQSGRASGCHLHFEMWSSPGWYRGGSAFDPLPRLRAWDRYS